MKTAEQILEDVCPNRPWQNGGRTDAMIIKCMKIFANQLIEICLEKSFEAIREGNSETIEFGDEKGKVIRHYYTEQAVSRHTFNQLREDLLNS